MSVYAIPTEILVAQQATELIIMVMIADEPRTAVRSPCCVNTYLLIIILEYSLTENSVKHS